MVSYQKLEEERLDKIKECLLTYFAREIAFVKSKGEKLNLREDAVKGISNEAEIKMIIATHEKKEKVSDEIAYKKVTCKYENVYQNYNSFTSKSADPGIFDVDKALEIPMESLEMSEEMVPIMHLLTNCWEGKHPSSQEKEEFKERIKTPIGRKIFGECLNKFRKNGMFSMKDESYITIAELMHVTMNIIQEQNDVENALSVMILSQTFYLDKKTDGKVDKMYLQLAIQQHPFWKNKAVWEKAISSAIEEENASQINPDETEADRQMRMQSTVFGKLGTFAHNMLQFEMAKADVELIISSYTTKYSLPVPYVSMLKVTNISNF